MCFSAAASFGASAVLGTIGIVALKRAQNPNQYFFSGIPVLFALQQFAEGILWIALSDPDFAVLKPPMTYAFLFFALIIWPIWAPFSILMVETHLLRRKILKYLLVTGLIMAIYSSLQILLFKVDSFIDYCHISYKIELLYKNNHWSSLPYLIPTLFAFFISGNRGIRIVGIVIFIAYIITRMFYIEYLISVWCFFAAIVSILILFVVVQPHEEEVSFRKRIFR
ncbi:MAG: hypothetical protein JEZ03_09825 [Bacteroidales bacterium]|nr:hypothetical protein [Bacteroidales bacterium]